MVLVAAAIAGGIALGGWAFSFHPFTPKLSKLDPIKGLGRVFGLKGLVEVAKALGKAGVVGAAALAVLVPDGRRPAQRSASRRSGRPSKPPARS